MTLTEAPPEHVERPEPQPLPSAGGWLTTADHKRLGLLFIAAAFLFLLVGGVAGMALRIELAEPGLSLLENNAERVYSLHTTVAALLFLAPLWLGLATHVLPLQIGAVRLAFPRLQAFAFWLYATGGALLLASYLIDDGPVGAGLGLSTPPEAGAPSLVATDLWVLSVVLVAFAVVLASVNLVVTAAKFRADGLTLRRVPAFTWATVATGAVTILATPVFVAGLLLLFLDRHFGGTFFAEDTFGTQVVWQHTLWLFGRPEIFLLALPGLGAATDIVVTHARRPLLDHDAALGLLAAFATLSFGAWAAGTEVAASVLPPTYSGLTALTAVPVALLALMWLGTLAKGQPRIHPSVLYVAGALVLWVGGAGGAVWAALGDIEGGTAFAVGYVHLVAFGAPTMLALGALHHWAPKLWGKTLSAGMGGLEVLLFLGGFLITGVASFALGADGAPAHVADLGDNGDWTNLSRAASLGGLLVLAAVLLFIVNVVSAKKKAPGDGGLTLEWSTTSPPPLHNFDAVPEVRSPYPLAQPADGGAP